MTNVIGTIKEAAQSDAAKIAAQAIVTAAVAAGTFLVIRKIEAK